MTWNDDIIQRARDVTGEDIAAAMIEKAYPGRYCKVRGCHSIATQPDGCCQKCSEELQALRGDLGGLTIYGDADPVTFVKRFPFWLQWLILVALFFAGGLVLNWAVRR